MKKLNLIFIMIAISGCLNHKNPQSLNSYRGTNGLLYYQLPSSGRLVTCVFLPYKNQSEISKNINLDSTNYLNGIQFSTAYTDLFIKSNALNGNVGYMKGDSTQKTFLIPNVRIFFHVDTPAYSEKTAINTSEIKHDDLTYNSKAIKTNFFFSTIAIDSMKIPNFNSK